MKKGRNQRPPRKMKQVFLVFCEGDTEEVYINFLKQKYRLPIKVIPRITGLSISQAVIKRYIQSEQIGPGDKIASFLMYDLDRGDTAEKIDACKDSTSIASNPAIELWFLLHNCEQNAAICTKDCIEKLKKTSPVWTSYKKGSLSGKQKELLWDNCKLACNRAKCLPERENPSSLIYRLIEAIEKYSLRLPPK